MGHRFRARLTYSETPPIAMILSGFLEKNSGEKGQQFEVFWTAPAERSGDGAFRNV